MTVMKDENVDSSNESKKKSEACFQFRDTGNCKFGEKCEFSHEMAIIHKALNSNPWPALQLGKAGAQFGLMPRGGGFGMSGPGMNYPPREGNRAPRGGDSKYDPQYCKACDATCDTKEMYRNHCSGKKHRENMFEVCNRADYACRPCLLVFETEEQMTTHQESDDHREQLKVNAERAAQEALKPMNDDDDEPSTIKPTTDKKVFLPDELKDEKFQTMCTLCAIPFNSQTHRKSHLEGKRHKKAVQIAQKPAHVIARDEARRKQKFGNKPTVGKCDVCHIEFDQKVQYEQHMAGKKHQKEVNKATRSRGLWNQSAAAAAGIGTKRSGIGATPQPMQAKKPRTGGMTGYEQQAVVQAQALAEAGRIAAARKAREQAEKLVAEQTAQQEVARLQADREKKRMEKKAQEIRADQEREAARLRAAEALRAQQQQQATAAAQQQAAAAQQAARPQYAQPAPPQPVYQQAAQPQYAQTAYAQPAQQAYPQQAGYQYAQQPAPPQQTYQPPPPSQWPAQY